MIKRIAYQSGVPRLAAAEEFGPSGFWGYEHGHDVHGKIHVAAKSVVVVGRLRHLP